MASPAPRGLAWLGLVTVVFAGCMGGPSWPERVDGCLATAGAARDDCFGEVFEEAAAEDGEAAVLDALAAAAREGRLDDCHMLAHHFGHRAYGVHQNVTSAFLAGKEVCSRGYFHGVIEAAIGGAGAMHSGHAHHATPSADLRTVCVGLRSDAIRYDACVHGLGHGLMHKHGHDVAQSLQDCQPLGAPADIQRCEDGVLMENSMQFLTLGEAEYAAKAPAACDGLDLAGRRYAVCHRAIGEIAMFYYGHDLERAKRLCNEVAGAEGRDHCKAGALEELEISRTHK